MTLAIPAGAAATQFFTTISVNGDLTITTPFHVLTLGKASLTIQTKAGKISSIDGTAQVTFPGLDTFSGLGVASPVLATFGYDTGASSGLAALGLPLAPSRKYVYVSFSAGLNASLGGSSISSNRGTSVALVFDPTDPAIFVAGPLGDISAIGISRKGLIPFTAATTYGFTDDDDFPTFSGHSYITGSMTLEEIPIVVTGAITSRYDGWNGTDTLNKKVHTHTVGVNGDIALGWDFLDGEFNFSLPVSAGSLYVSTTVYPYAAQVSVSGTAGTATFLPSWVPVLLSDNASIAGSFDTTDLSTSWFEGQSDLTIGASQFGALVGLPLNDLVLAESSFRVDQEGFRFRGTSSIGLTPQLLSTTGTITACFGGNTTACLGDDQTGVPVIGSKDWLIQLEGDTTLLGVPLGATTALASSTGIALSATYATPISQVAMSGLITGSSVLVTGSASVSIPFTLANETLEAITSGVLCGYQKITSAAVCGYDILNFTDVFHCGKPHCSWSWRHGLRCSLSCSASIPRVCDDLTRPNTCTPNAVDFNLGTVDGAVAITITNAGISGKVSGKFCPAGSSNCTSFSEAGTVDFSSITAPRVCLNTNEIPISPPLPSGKFCVPL